MKKALQALILCIMCSVAPLQAATNIDVRLDSSTAGGVLLASLGAYLVKYNQRVVGVPVLITGVAMATNNQEIIKSIFVIADKSLNTSYDVIKALYDKLARTYTSLTEPSAKVKRIQ